MKLALLQTRDHGSPAANLENALSAIRQAAEEGAEVAVLPELFLTAYFCATQDHSRFGLAEPIPGPTTEKLGQVAAECEVVIVASLFEARGPGLYHNSAAVLDADGSFLGLYRKAHIPQDPGFEEKFYFTPGDTGYRVFQTRYGKIGVLLCWDQWYPEAARLTAMQGAEVLLYPTAIGWLPEEKADWGPSQHQAWETVQKAHAIANGCYLAAVNRVGIESGTEFWGQSFGVDPFGQLLVRGSSDREERLLMDTSLAAMEEIRQIWPFFRDRRIDTYGDLTKRWEE
ncbi:MAG: carbon-nitrogen hydrolase [Verrucomicrobiota bacterium]